MALEVGKVFDTDKVIVSYDNLGIARLIYHLPTTLCETFLHEVFKVGSIESLDHETLFTIQKFFENNLNIDEEGNFLLSLCTKSTVENCLQYAILAKLTVLFFIFAKNTCSFLWNMIKYSDA